MMKYESSSFSTSTATTSTTATISTTTPSTATASTSPIASVTMDEKKRISVTGDLGDLISEKLIQRVSKIYTHICDYVKYYVLLNVVTVMITVSAISLIMSLYDNLTLHKQFFIDVVVPLILFGFGVNHIVQLYKYFTSVDIRKECGLILAALILSIYYFCIAWMLCKIVDTHPMINPSLFIKEHTNFTITTILATTGILGGILILVDMPMLKPLQLDTK